MGEEALNIILVPSLIPTFTIHPKNSEKIKYSTEEWKERKKRAEHEISRVVRQLRAEYINITDIEVIEVCFGDFSLWIKFLSNASKMCK